MRTELKRQYIIYFNWRTKLKQIKTYIIEIRARRTNYKGQGRIWILTKNSLVDVTWRSQERESGGKIQTTIDTCREIVVTHAPHQVEGNMPGNHSRCRLGIFGRRMKPHAPPESRVSAETDGASDNGPTVIRRKKIKYWLITVKPLQRRLVFCPFRGTKSLMHCSMKY